MKTRNRAELVNGLNLHHVNRVEITDADLPDHYEMSAAEEDAICARHAEEAQWEEMWREVVVQRMAQGVRA